jgi:hypothetical protein
LIFSLLVLPSIENGMEACAARQNPYFKRKKANEQKHHAENTDFAVIIQPASLRGWFR